MITVQGVGGSHLCLDTNGSVWEGDSPVRVIPSVGIENEI